jgi:hypothetical protein
MCVSELIHTFMNIMHMIFFFPCESLHVISGSGIQNQVSFLFVLRGIQVLTSK